VATALIPNFKLLEIDDNQKTNKVFTSSEVLENRVLSVTTKEGEEAFGRALFEAMDDGSNIIIDAGGGNDSRAVIEIILNQTAKTETLFLIPLMTDPEQVQNAIDTYNLAKDRPLAFILNNGRSRDEFTHWHGNKQRCIAGVDPKIQKLPTAYVPWSDIFGEATMTGEVIADIAGFAAMFESPAEARTAIYKKAEGNTEAALKMWARYNLSVRIDNFIKDDLSELKNIIEA
jgi:hypothetical protein